MASHLVLRQAVVVVSLALGGCQGSKPTDATVQDVEVELRNQLAPPGAYVSVMIGQRTVKLSHPAMRVTRVTISLKGELVITSVGLRDGGEKTDTIPLTDEEATRVRELKSVTFALGGDRVHTEQIPVAGAKKNP